ncbi:MAG TPA: NAD-dependent protein deacylase [Actinomycetota bacterium]|nr:NAD-dependent protein deacylase [Actinomycetota bacterium]
MDGLDPGEVRRAADVLRSAARVLFVTGAGISADSGLPTYRGIGGLYERDTTEEGYPIEVALSGAMLAGNPALCWKYIAQIERACRGARFNAAHAFLAEHEKRVPGTWILTQNVDGFHLDAGSRNVIEVHGNVRRLHCTACEWETEVADYSSLEIPPKCPACAGLVRPRVVLFGEMLPDDAVRALQRELASGFDAVVAIGTTAVFPYIAGPVIAAARAGLPTIEVNPGDTTISDAVSIRLRAGAVAALTALGDALGAEV